MISCRVHTRYAWQGTHSAEVHRAECWPLQNIHLLQGSFPSPSVFLLLCVSCEFVLPKVDETTFGETHSQDTHNSGNTEGGGNDPRNITYFGAIVQESTILAFPPPFCMAHPSAILLHDYYTVLDSPSDLPFVCCTPYNIGNTNIL